MHIFNRLIIFMVLNLIGERGTLDKLTEAQTTKYLVFHLY
jgi:hypothetical protein